MSVQALHPGLTVAHQLVGVLAAEKSKVPFYVAGGALVAWALIVSLVLGLRHPAAFPRNLTGERTVIAITAVLVVGAMSTAVITASTPAKAGASTSAGHPPATSGAPPASAPAPPTSTSAPPAAGAAPKATTGAPAAPSAPAAGAPSKLKLAANPTGLLSYNTKQLTAKAGTVTIELTNNSPLEHNVTVAQGATVLGATPTFIKDTKSLTLTLKPGTYTFYCSVPGHRQAGMEGTLSVS
jgi:plastocyanin